MAKVLAFGEIMLRLSPPGRELLLQTPRFDVWVAGAEANVATALARLGHDVGFASMVPDNDLGRSAIGTRPDATPENRTLDHLIGFESLPLSHSLSLWPRSGWPAGLQRHLDSSSTRSPLVVSTRREWRRIPASQPALPHAPLRLCINAGSGHLPLQPGRRRVRRFLVPESVVSVTHTGRRAAADRVQPALDVVRPCGARRERLVPDIAARCHANGSRRFAFMNGSIRLSGGVADDLQPAKPSPEY